MVRLAGAVPYRNVYGHDVKAKSASFDMYSSFAEKDFNFKSSEIKLK